MLTNPSFMQGKHRLINNTLLLLMATFCWSCSSPGSRLGSLPWDYAQAFAGIPAGLVFLEHDTLVVEAFWMARHEVSNGKYQLFLEDLLAQGHREAYASALPDDNAWNQLSVAASLRQNYFTEAAFRDFPVVNISYEAALLYCQWLEEQLNRNTSKKNPYQVRLPYRAEWVLAAQGGTSRPYAWQGTQLYHPSGAWRARFRTLPESLIQPHPQSGQLEFIRPGTDPNLQMIVRIPQSEWIMTRVDAYDPGIQGLYNLNGNVAEMVMEAGIALGGSWYCDADHIHNLSILEMQGPSPRIGFRPVIVRRKPSF